MSKSVILTIFDCSDRSSHSLSIESENIERLQLFKVHDAFFFKDDQFMTKKVADKFYISAKNAAETFGSFHLSKSIYLEEIKVIDGDKVESFGTELDPSFTAEINDDLLIFSQL